MSVTDLNGSTKSWVTSRCPSHSQVLQGIGALISAPMAFRRNVEVYGEGEPSEYLYHIQRGAVRTYKVLTDGRRQVGGFYLAGETFGFETDEAHSFSAETISDCKLLVIKRSALVALAAQDYDVACQLWALTGAELRKVQDHILLLIKNAEERVAAFLLEMADRGSAGSTVELPMSRQDIADYLGLTIETVSRTLRQLESNATIHFSSSRRIELRDRSALARLNT